MGQQQKLPLHEAPAFTVKEVQEKFTKPKEPKAKKNDTSSAKAKDEEKLPATVEATEAEITALREQKAAAVENEDFDKAHSLKSREKVLVSHLESLKAAKSEL